MSYVIAKTKTLNRRVSGDVAFFDGALSVDGEMISVRIQTKAADEDQYGIDGDRLVPQSESAQEAIKLQIEAARARTAAFAATQRRLLAEAPAKVEEIVADICDGATPAEIAAVAAWLDVCRKAAAEIVAARVEHGREWEAISRLSDLTLDRAEMLAPSLRPR